MGIIHALCLSSAKGTVKHGVPEAELRAGHGLVGDAHAGDWHRQVSLLAAESIARVREQLPDLADGAFGENVITAGVELGALRIGDCLRLGDTVELEVTQIGKECHTACAIGLATGRCIMPDEGIFCRVLSGGVLRPGDPVSL